MILLNPGWSKAVRDFYNLFLLVAPDFIKAKLWFFPSVQMCLLDAKPITLSNYSVAVSDPPTTLRKTLHRRA